MQRRWPGGCSVWQMLFATICNLQDYYGALFTRRICRCHLDTRLPVLHIKRALQDYRHEDKTAVVGPMEPLGNVGRRQRTALASRGRHYVGGKRTRSGTGTGRVQTATRQIRTSTFGGNDGSPASPRYLFTPLMTSLISMTTTDVDLLACMYKLPYGRH